METSKSLAIQASKPLLMEQMASHYGMDPAAFKSVLLKTVFPQDKQVSMEQLGMFVIVAHNYSLNPMIREIYAFPSKGGGIIPVVGYDGWISLVQRKEDYDGCEYEYVWENDKPGGSIVGVTCIIHRKKHSRPTKKTVWFNEVRRDTDQWKIKPVWMTEIKAFIQTARLAYGFGGIYDEDEAQNILEAQLKQGPDGVLRSEIQMPQRQKTIEAVPVQEEVVPEEKMQEEPQPQETTPEPDNPKIQELGQALFGDPEPPAKDAVKTIGKGRADRIKAIIGSKKTRTHEELEELKKTFKIEHLADLPENRYKDIERWANGE